MPKIDFKGLQRKRAHRLGFSPYTVVSHFLVGVCAFQWGFTAGSSSENSAVDPKRSLQSISALSTSMAKPNEPFPDTVNDLFVGTATVPRKDFIQEYDIGMPWDQEQKGFRDVLMLYSSSKSLPLGYESGTAFTSALDATQNCDTMNVILTKPRQDGQCFAVVGQWSAYHLHKFARVKEGANPSFSTKYPLTNVSRRHELSGKKPQFPTSRQVSRYHPMLIDYLQRLELTQERLKPLVAESAGTDNTVVVMLTNFGQSELLVNFVCSARARGLDLSKIVVFATDSDAYELANSLEISAFDVQDAFGVMPTDAAKMYGDRSFQKMMLSKVYCVHLVNSLGYDVLFQDVDVVWYRNPLEYFHSDESGKFDFYFQDDGAHSSRYAPYSPNSGFYYIRNNERTQYFFQVFIRMGDLIIASGSHQSVLNDLLTEQASSRGLRVKVFQRDDTLGQKFPGGFHFHKRKNFMKELIQGDASPFIFHMSWTKNKDNKQRFYQQLGDWFVEDHCVNKRVHEISIQGSILSTCCSAKPLQACHYRDKPSKVPCRQSPPIDNNGKSFW